MENESVELTKTIYQLAKGLYERDTGNTTNDISWDKSSVALQEHYISDARHLIYKMTNNGKYLYELLS